MKDYPLKDLPFKHVARTVKFNESANQSLDDKYRIINERENAVELFLSDSDVAASLKPYIKVVENEKLHDAGHKEIALTTMLTVVDKEGIKDLLMEEIGKRFVEITNKLNDMGVFYGKNYDGKYHEKYPHSSYWFSIDLDKHRGCFEANIMNGGGIEKTIAVIRGTDPAMMIVELLEEAHKYLTTELNDT